MTTNILAAKELLGSSVFLLGAGGTRDAGCLTSNGMLESIKNLDLSQPEHDAIDFLLSSLQYHATWKTLKERNKHAGNSHQANIEDLMLLIRRIVNRDSYLPFPITGSWADKINFLEIEWRSTREYNMLEINKRKSLFETLEDKLTFQLYSWLCVGVESTDYLNPIDEYLRAVENDSLPLEFFTLNYDLVFEKHFNRNSETTLSTGFTSGIFKGHEHKLTENSYRINYYKLHGSINWTRDDTVGRIRESFIYDDRNGGAILNPIDTCEEVSIDSLFTRVPRSPLVIFGHGGKFMSVDPFISLLYEFKKQVDEKDLIFVIGYSFFDPYINNILLEGLIKEATNPKLMIIVNPSFGVGDGGLITTEEMNSLDDDQKTTTQKNRFIDLLKGVQESAYLSDLPSFNVTEISPNRVKIIGINTKDFFKDFFSPEGNGFLMLKNEIDELRKEGEIF